MPWGQYRGCALKDIDAGYLRWLLAQPWLKPALGAAITAELANRREGTGRLPDPDAMEELMTAGLRTLTLKHHPDVGGDTAKMQSINAAAARLRATAGGRK